MRGLNNCWIVSIEGTNFQKVFSKARKKDLMEYLENQTDYGSNIKVTCGQCNEIPLVDVKKA